MSSSLKEGGDIQLNLPGDIDNNNINYDAKANNGNTKQTGWFIWSYNDEDDNKNSWSMDCHDLLEHVMTKQQEHRHSSSSSYTPATTGVRNNNVPQVEMMQLPRHPYEHDLFLLVAYTSHAASVQLISTNTTTNDDDDSTTHLEYGDIMGVFNVPPIDSIHDNNNGGDDYDYHTSDDGSAPSTSTSTITTLSMCALEGQWRPITTDDSASDECLNVSIILGMSDNRVLAIQFQISFNGLFSPKTTATDSKSKNKNYFSLTRFSESTPYSEPLPLDYPPSSNNNNNNNKYLSSSHPSSDRLSSTNSNNNNTASMKDTSDTSSVYNTSTTKSTTLNKKPHKSSTSNKLEKALESAMESTKDVSPEDIYVPFRPTGGVSTLYYHHDTHFVWVAYGDGTVIRLPHEAFFPFATSTCHVPSAIRSRILIPNHSTKSTNNNPNTIVPLPTHHPSILSYPFSNNQKSNKNKKPSSPTSGFGDTHNTSDESAIKKTSFVDSNNNDNEEEKKLEDGDDEFCFIQAIAYSSDLSTLGIYTNEDQLYGQILNENLTSKNDFSQYINFVKDTIFSGTKTIARGVLGGVFSAVQWAASSKSGNNNLNDSIQEEQDDDSVNGGMGVDIGDDDDVDREANGKKKKSSSIFPQLNRYAKDIPLSLLTQLDVPRKFSNASVSPDGKFVAVADNLGRVQLLDLASKQIIRMWKGVRDATCHWIQLPLLHHHHQSVVLYLAIHIRQRSVVEVYRMRHGPRVGVWKTDPTSQIIQTTVPSSSNNLSTSPPCTVCFLITTTNHKVNIEPLKIRDPAVIQYMKNNDNNNSSNNNDDNSNTITEESLSTIVEKSTNSNTTMQLKLLQQLLASETHVHSDLDAVYVALTQITTISELSKALNLLAVATHLEDGMGVDGSRFHAEAVAHCKEQLEFILQDEETKVSRNPVIDELSRNIELHSQLIAAYDMLNKFETGSYSDDDDDDRPSSPRTAWALEAISWTDTYQKVTGLNLDFDIPKMDSDTPLKFSTFAKACLQDEKLNQSNRNSAGVQMIYLCDSTKDRKAILLHLFRPLLHDIFVFKVVNGIFGCLGINNDYEKLQEYFGEWFISLPAKCIAKSSLFGSYCPTVRWLQEILSLMMEEKIANGTDEGSTKNEIYLNSLYKFCSKTDDLSRAFLLAVICWEAISITSKQYEEKTYGKISSEDAVKPWEALVRKLRVCLLFSLRLFGESLGPLPITVDNIEDGSLFSIYQWIARDQLSFSKENDKIIAFEQACYDQQEKSKAIKFDPSTSSGDLLIRWKKLQTSCVESSLPNKEKEMPVSFDNDDEQSFPLLFYFDQFNDPVKLAAHRALILTEMWGKDPNSLQLLREALATLKHLKSQCNGSNRIAHAICAEVWETHIRPIYRALFFGFHDVHEVSEDVMETLLMSDIWRHRLNKISLDLLSLFYTQEAEESTELEIQETGHSNRWPSVEEDPILNHISRRGSVPSDHSSLDLHKAVILATHINDDLTKIPFCFPMFEEIFLPTSLFSGAPSMVSFSEYQMEFLEDTMNFKADNVIGHTIRENEIEEMSKLGFLWGVDKSTILTKFVLAVYEAGKDSMVDALVKSQMDHINASIFVKGAIQICCIRLNATINIVKRSKQYRGIMGMLEADTCQWVKEQAEVAIKSRPAMKNVGKDGEIPNLDGTHSLVLKILKMNKDSRSEAHAVSVMSGTLLRAFQEIQCKKVSEGFLS